MPKFTLIELKIWITSIIATSVLNMDAFVRFLAPLLSAICWFYLKPALVKWHEKRKQKKK